MQGIYIDFARPASKKAVKQAVTDAPSHVHIEATSMFGDEYDGPLDKMPDGRITFVGPDPYTSRKFYGTIIKQGDTYKVS